MRADRILNAYRLIFATAIIALSVLTAIHAKRVTDHHFWLAAIEIVAALLFMVRRTQQIGMSLLLAVFAVVAVHDVATGEIPVSLLLFGATAIAIVMLDRAIR
jgi:hypothetical protein